MILKNIGTESITIRRFDTDENISIESGDSVDVDDETGAYLLELKITSTDPETGENNTTVQFELV